MTKSNRKEFGNVIGIEGIGGAILRAKDNAAINSLKAKFFAGQVEELIDKKLSRLEHPFIVVDPARRGLEKGVISLLHKYAPCAVAYISCSPRSMAEDLAQFVSLGWRVTSIRAYDMIPNSAHIEMLAILEPDPNLLVRYRKPLRKVVR